MGVPLEVKWRRNQFVVQPIAAKAARPPKMTNPVFNNRVYRMLDYHSNEGEANKARGEDSDGSNGDGGEDQGRPGSGPTKKLAAIGGRVLHLGPVVPTSYMTAVVPTNNVAITMTGNLSRRYYSRWHPTPH